MLALLSAMLSVPTKTAPATVHVSKDDVFSSSPSLQLDTVVPDASFAWTTFSSGGDCEANGCITPSSEAECEDAMLALTYRSTLRHINSTNYPRCFTTADSSNAPLPHSSIYYNNGTTTGLHITWP